MTQVVALAGRRIDAPDAPIRFSPRSVEPVRGLLRAYFTEGGASCLVSSAACGADLLALDVAGSLDMRRRVVLPYSPERFRETSVTDRKGDWGPLFDEVVEAVSVSGDLVVLEGQKEGSAAYAAAQEAILDEAQAIAAAEGSELLAAVVWNGDSRGAGDMTERFAQRAEARGIAVDTILTV